MTTELVKQLRKLSAENPSERDCIDVAADELERLCAENGNLKREAWTWSKACETEAGKVKEHRNAAMEADLRTQAAVRGEKQAIARLTAITRWIEANQPDVFKRGLWVAIETPNGEVRGASRPAGEASASTVVLEVGNGGKNGT